MTDKRTTIRRSSWLKLTRRRIATSFPFEVSYTGLSDFLATLSPSNQDFNNFTGCLSELQLQLAVFQSGTLRSVANITNHKILKLSVIVVTVKLYVILLLVRLLGFQQLNDTQHTHLALNSRKKSSFPTICIRSYFESLFLDYC